MADEIKKVGIELTAQGAKEFKQSLKEISAATTEAYYELKLAQSQYDKNTSSSQKLADKQQYLAKQVENYTKKEAVLKQQLAEMENAENRDEAAISKKKAEINKCEATLNGYKKSLEEVNKELSGHGEKLKEWGEKLQKVGSKVSAVGDGLTKGLTVPIAAVGAAAVTAWKEVDEGLDIIATKTGASGEALEEMQDIAKELAMTIPTSFETAGEAVGEVSTRFEVTGDELEALSGKFIKFAEINESDVSSSVDNVQKLMAAWGVETKDTGKVLDLLTAQSQKSGVSVDTLSQMAQQNKVALGEMGLSMEDSVALLASLDKNGLEAGDVMTGLKKAMQNAAKEGKTSKQAFSELQQGIMGARTDAQAAQIAMELFGNKAGPGIAKAMREGKLSLDDMGISLDDFAGTVDSTFDEIQDPLDQMQPVLNTLKVTGADLVNTAGPAIAALMKRLADGAKGLKEKWDGLSDGQKELILKIAGLAAAIGPVLSVGGRLIGGIGTVLKYAPMVSTAITALSGPIGIVVLAIGGLVAAGVLLYKNWDKICAWAKELKKKVTENWNSLKTSVTTAVTGIKDKATAKFNELKSKVQSIHEGMRSYIGGKLNAIKSAYSTNGGGLKGIASATMEAVKQYYSLGYDAINSLTGGKLGQVVSAARTKMAEMKTAVSDKLANIKESFSTKLQSAKETVSNKMENIRSTIGNKLQSAKDTVSTRMESIRSAIGNKLQSARDTAASKMESIRSAISDKMNSAKSTVKSVINGIKSLFNFSWSLPHLKLPHVSISGSFSLVPPSVPSFSVKWYRKAYDDVYAFSEPTVLATAAGLKGFGDGPGTEYVMGEKKLQQIASGGITPNVLYTIIVKALEHMQVKVVLNGREVTRSLKDLGVMFA